MTKNQRQKYETFVRVRDYGVTHQGLFPESSIGGQAFASMAAMVATIDEILEARMLARADARRVKSITRAQVFESMKTIAYAARRAARLELVNHPFQIPRRRSLKVDISTARLFIDEAGKRQEQFARLGLPPAFISDFERLVDALQRNVDTRLNSKSTRSFTRKRLETELARGSELVRDLDVAVAVATHGDPARAAAWRSARLVEGNASSSSTNTKTVVPLTVVPSPNQPVADAKVTVDATSPPAVVPSPVTPETPTVRPEDDVMGRAS